MKALKKGAVKNISYLLAILVAVTCSIIGTRTPAWAEEAVRSKEKARAVKVLLNDLVDGNPQGLTEDQKYILEQAAEVLNAYSISAIEINDAATNELQPRQANAMLNASSYTAQPQQANAMVRALNKAQPQQANAMLKLQPQQANAMLKLQPQQANAMLIVK